MFDCQIVGLSTVSSYAEERGQIDKVLQSSSILGCPRLRNARLWHLRRAPSMVISFQHWSGAHIDNEFAGPAPTHIFKGGVMDAEPQSVSIPFLKQ